MHTNNQPSRDRRVAGFEDGNDAVSGWIFIYSVFMRRKWLIFSVTSIFVLAGLLTAFLLPKEYEAEADMLVEKVSESQKAMLFRVNMPNLFDRIDWLNSEIQIIKSHPVAENVIKTLNLHLIDVEEQLTTEEIDEKFREKVQSFRDDIRISKVGNSNVLRLRSETKSPDLSAKVIETTINFYKEHRAKLFQESEEYDFYKTQVELADENLRELESKLTDFKREESIVEPESQGRLLAAKMSDYQATLNTVQTQRIGKEARLSIIKQQLAENIEITLPYTEVTDSPSRSEYLTKLKSDILDWQLKRDELLQKYSPEYSEVVDLENKVKAGREKLRTEIQEIVDQEETSVRVLLAQERRLTRAMDSVRVDIGQHSEKGYQLAQLSRGIEDKRELYSVLLRQRDQARLSLLKAERDVRIRVVSPATPPLKPSKPRKKATVAIAFFLGFFVASALAFLMESMGELKSQAKAQRELYGRRATDTPASSVQAG